MCKALARTEVLRALVLEGADGLAHGRAVLGAIDLPRVNDRVLAAAGTLLPSDVRSLDAAQHLGIRTAAPCNRALMRR